MSHPQNSHEIGTRSRPFVQLPERKRRGPALLPGYGEGGDNTASQTVKETPNVMLSVVPGVSPKSYEYSHREGFSE